jgi:hypothetical protein
MEVRPDEQPHDSRRRKGLLLAQDVPKGSQWLFHHAKKIAVAPTTTPSTTSLVGTTGKIHEDRQQLNTITTTTTKKVIAIITFLALASWSNLVVYDSTAVWLDTHRQLHREETLWFRPPPPPPPPATAVLSLDQQLPQQPPQSLSQSSLQQRRRDLVQLAIQHRESSSANITAAVCFKTLFGTIDLGIVIQWAGAYCIEIVFALLLCCVRCGAVCAVHSTEWDYCSNVLVHPIHPWT